MINISLPQIFLWCGEAGAGRPVQGRPPGGDLVEHQAGRGLPGGRGGRQWETTVSSLSHLLALLSPQVDREGRLTGPEIAYIYPDHLTVLVGQFNEGLMVAGQAGWLVGLEEGRDGVKVPTFQRSEAAEHLHRRQIGRYNYICDGT